MRKYEAAFVFRPDVTEEERVATFDRFKGIMERNGQVESVDEWGLKKLAYEINYYKEGYYYIVRFESTPEDESEVKRVAKITDTLLRWMVIRLED